MGISDLKTSVCETIDQSRDQIIGLGESIMDDPELGFKEFQTSNRVKEQFEALGLLPEQGMAITGVKAILKGGKPGPTVALMGELDALQVPGHPRANPETGAAHACGHNAQIAGMMGAAIGLQNPALPTICLEILCFMRFPQKSTWKLTTELD